MRRRSSSSSSRSSRGRGRRGLGGVTEARRRGIPRKRVLAARWWGLLLLLLLQRLPQSQPSQPPVPQKTLLPPQRAQAAL
jgi:hypothetical protein